MTHKEGDVECRDDGDTDQEKAYVAAHHAKLRLIWQFVQGVALCLPAGTESDVRQADTAPDEEVGEAGQGEQPGKDSRAGRGLANEGQETEGDLDQNAPDGSALLVDVLEEVGAHFADGKSLHGPS